MGRSHWDLMAPSFLELLAHVLASVVCPFWATVETWRCNMTAAYADIKGSF